MFKRTQSLTNAACFKHDNNVCACTVNTLILFEVVNLLLEMNSATSISYMTWKVSQFDAAFRLFWGFFTAYTQPVSFDHDTTSGLKSDVTFEFSAPVFL